MAICRGRDTRGWAVIDVYPSKTPKVIITKIDGKHLELVSQAKGILRVYINPQKEGFDEWELPAGSGNRVEVGSPPEDPDLVASGDESTVPTDDDFELVAVDGPHN